MSKKAKVEPEKAKVEGGKEDKPVAGTDDDQTPLNPRQKMFISEYLVDLNATAAVIRSGYSKNGASVQGTRMLADPKIAAAVQIEMEKRSKRVEVTMDNVVKELAKMAFADMRQYVVWGEKEIKDGGEIKKELEMKLIHSSELPPELTAAVSEVKLTKDGLSFKLHDKKGSLELLGRHLGGFREIKEITGKGGGPIQVARAEALTDEELAKIAVNSDK